MRQSLTLEMVASAITCRLLSEWLGYATRESGSRAHTSPRLPEKMHLKGERKLIDGKTDESCITRYPEILFK